jgi:hypothetical protein
MCWISNLPKAGKAIPEVRKGKFLCINYNILNGIRKEETFECMKIQIECMKHIQRIDKTLTTGHTISNSSLHRRSYGSNHPRTNVS